jgi:adenylate cyclase class 2
MPYEIEQKFRCSNVALVRERLLELGAAPGQTVDQADCYYRHPVRDFSQTDEAFRLRRVGDVNFMTYKGPKIDATTKSRHEEEVRLADGVATWKSCDEIVRRLGFESVAVVRKRRETLHLDRGDQSIEAALDDVADVGTFVELEVSVDSAGDDAPAVDSAKRALADLAGELGLIDSERRSYLELLLASAPGSAGGLRQI